MRPQDCLILQGKRWVASPLQNQGRWDIAFQPNPRIGRMPRRELETSTAHHIVDNRPVNPHAVFDLAYRIYWTGISNIGGK